MAYAGRAAIGGRGQGSRVIAAAGTLQHEVLLRGNAEASFQEAQGPAACAEGTGWSAITQMAAGHIAAWAGRIPEAEGFFRGAHTADVVGRDDGFGWAGLLLLLAYQGRADECEPLWRNPRMPLPVDGVLNRIGDSDALPTMAETAAIMDRPVGWAAWDDPAVLDGLVPAPRAAGDDAGAAAIAIVCATARW